MSKRQDLPKRRAICYIDRQRLLVAVIPHCLLTRRPQAVAIAAKSTPVGQLDRLKYDSPL